jgi:CheY-like chemotaxis protein
MSQKVLVVDDDGDVRALVCGAMAAAGFSVEQADCGEDGLMLLRAAPGAFALIITDLAMPGMTGLEMLIAAGPDLGEAKVLLFTGFASSIRESSNLRVRVLAKPIAPGELAIRANELLQAA